MGQPGDSMCEVGALERPRLQVGRACARSFRHDTLSAFHYFAHKQYDAPAVLKNLLHDLPLGHEPLEQLFAAISLHAFFVALSSQ